MCRHLAYVGAPLTLQELLLDPPYSLATQAWAPRFQRHGTVNADGFGAGWYLPGRIDPVRYRRAQPIWSDASFASLAPTITTTGVLAAVRDATPGFSHDESCTAPFTHRDLLFSHNGRIDDWPRVRKALWEEALQIPEAAAPVDSAFLFGLVAARRLSGRPLGQALVSVVHDVVAYGGGRLTMLLTDGATITGTVYGEPLFRLVREEAAVVASEPFDRSEDWREVPDGTLVEARPASLTVTPLHLPA